MGIVVPMFSVFVDGCVLGGSLADFDFVHEMAGLWSSKGVCWLVSAIVSGGTAFGFAAHLSKNAKRPADAVTG